MFFVCLFVFSLFMDRVDDHMGWIVEVGPIPSRSLLEPIVCGLRSSFHPQDFVLSWIRRVRIPSLLILISASLLSFSFSHLTQCFRVYILVCLT